MSELFQEVNETPEMQPADYDTLDVLVEELRGESLQPGDITSVQFKERYGYSDNKSAVRMMHRVAGENGDYEMVMAYNGKHSLWVLRRVGKMLDKEA